MSSSFVLDKGAQHKKCSEGILISHENDFYDAVFTSGMPNRIIVKDWNTEELESILITCLKNACYNVECFEIPSDFKIVDLSGDVSRKCLMIISSYLSGKGINKIIQ